MTVRRGVLCLIIIKLFRSGGGSVTQPDYTMLGQAG